MHFWEIRVFLPEVLALSHRSNENFYRVKMFGQTAVVAGRYCFSQVSVSHPVHGRGGIGISGLVQGFFLGGGAG